MTPVSKSIANGGRRTTPPPAAVEIDRPEVVAEVAAAFAAYERALSANDVAHMNDAFWSDAVRYGIAECQYGAEAIAAWRATADPVPSGRTLGPTVVTAFGDDSACVSTEFRYPGDAAVGRQSQTWIRFPAGWKIVHAHVSLLPTEEESG